MQFSDIITQVANCKFAPNSSFFLYYENKKIFVKQSSVNLNNFSVIPVSSNPSDILISPDSELISVLFKQKSLILVYSAKGVLIAKIEDTQSGISGMIWCPDSFQLIVFSQLLYKCTIYNLTDKSVSLIRSPKLSSAKGCIFSSNGKLMSLLERHDCKDTVGIYFCGDWKLVNSIPLDSFDVVEIKWDFNDSYIVAWENPINYRLYAICPYKGVIFKYQPYDFALGIKTVQFSNRSLFLAVGSFDQKIRLLNALTWKLIGELDCSSPTISSDLTKIYKQDDSMKSNNRMKLVDRTQYKIPITKPVLNEKSSPAQGVGLLQFSCDDNFLACRNDCMPYTVFIWNVSTLQIETIISLNSQVKMIKWDKFQNSLCIAYGTDKVLFWKNGIILECSFPIQNRKFSIQRFSLSNDCKRMLLFDKNQCIYSDLVNSD